MFKCEQATVQEQTDPISAYGDISTMQSLDQKKKNNKTGLCYNDCEVGDVDTWRWSDDDERQRRQQQKKQRQQKQRLQSEFAQFTLSSCDYDDANNGDVL